MLADFNDVRYWNMFSIYVHFTNGSNFTNGTKGQ